MNCWKCQAPLRSAEARFCPNCGAATQSATPPDDWRKRIDAAGQTGAGWRLLAKILLVLVSGGLLLYPIFFVRNRRRLSRHIADHLVSPRFEAGRFQATPEGQNILARLQRLAGSPRALGIPTAIFLYCFILLPLGILFIGPTFAPAYVGYDRALERVLECSSTRGWISVRSRSHYQTTLNQLKYQYDYGYINYNQATAGESGLNLPTSQYYGGPDGDWHNKPYEYLYTGGGRPTVYRASSIEFYWDGSETLGVIFYIALSLMALVLMIAHIRHWVRFARHRAVEVLAASYLRGDLRYHDELMADVRGRNAGLTFAVIAFTLSQFHLLAFPFMAPWMLRWHIEWEERVGIDRALGTATSPT